MRVFTITSLNLMPALRSMLLYVQNTEGLSRIGREVGIHHGIHPVGIFSRIEIALNSDLPDRFHNLIAASTGATDPRVSAICYPAALSVIVDCLFKGTSCLTSELCDLTLGRRGEGVHL